MGTLKLGLGADPSNDSEENPGMIEAQRARDLRHWDVMNRVLDPFFEGRRAIFSLAFVLALFTFVGDWAGYRGKLMPWGDPKPLREIWWHLPVMFAMWSVLLLVWYGLRTNDGD